MRLNIVRALLTLVAFAQPSLFAASEIGADNPTGVAGTFNGEITTGCAYDPYTANAKRVVDDIIVPGSVGAYPLKWTRYFNSHLTYGDNQIGGAWRFSYKDYKYFPSIPGDATGLPPYPDGRRLDPDAFGVEDFVDSQGLHMSDGGKVVYASGVFSGRGYNYPVQIIDPYGQTTTLSWSLITGGNGMVRLDRVTEPGGRYLQINWDSASSVITSVQAFDGSSTTPTQWVNYTWQTQTVTMPDGSHPNPYKVLTQVAYSDGTAATYTYVEESYPVPCSTPPGQFFAALLATADDSHYAGPMKQVAYKYATSGNKTRISSENHLVNGQASEAVSTLTGVLSSGSTQNVTETRGDSPQRSFTYFKVPGSGDNCTGRETPAPAPTDGKLNTYTDFQAHTTTIGYDSGGFIQTVADANGHTTTYERVGAQWGITKITHPDGNTIQQTFWNNQPYYLASRTDENLHETDYIRDANNRITTKNYPVDTNGNREYETFAYNNFGQTLTHRMRSGAYEYFKYDSRGLLTDKTNPTWTNYNYDANNLGNWPTNEPATHYDYYGPTDYSGVWTDRIKMQTDPRGLQTQFDYDRTLDANGENSGFSTAQAPVGGRGFVTRISFPQDTHPGETPTYPSGTYKSFGYDKYGNKDWEEDEMRERTSYTYDDYRRVLTIKNPLNKTVTNTYTPTNGTNSSSYVHNTSSIYTITTPTGIVTQNIYDQNFRKTSTTHAYGTSLAATTTFAYDAVGNPTTVTDPLNHTTTTAYDTRNRKITLTDALNQVTQWFYDAASNVTSIQRADGTTETKTYDQMNRVLTDTVPQTSTINVTTTFNYYPGNAQYGGLMKQVIDADGHITTFTTYDPSGLKMLVTYPNGDTHIFGYDNDKNLITRQTANTTVQNFSYDNRNRKATMFWTNPNSVSNFTAEWSSFTYDGASRLTNAQNGSGSTVGQGTIYSTITRQYDAAGRLTLDRQNLNATLGNKDVQYSYDDDGKDTRLYLTSAGYDYTFSYDAMGRFEKIFVTGAGTASFQYKYDAASNEVERDNLVNSVNQFYSRDALNRMSERDVKLSATVLSSEAYGYDPMSRMLSTLREDGNTDSFTYYLDGELWTANYGATNRSVTYNIDQMGNRTSVVDTGVTTTYTPAAGGLNQYARVGTNSVGNGSEHGIASYQGISYGYVNDERLKSINDSHGNSYQLLYDALGRCVKRTLNNAPTYYIYDGEKPMVEYNSGGSVVALNLYGKGIDEILMRIDATYGTSYYQDDHEGSVTHLINSTGTVIENYRYDVFGAPTINGGALTTSAFGNRFMFTGREYTSTFGVYEYRARAYHPGLGRFTGEDPKGFDAGDYNLFRYCHNDPEDITDPMGLYYDDQYEGQANRFEMVQTITHPGADRYGQTPIDRAITVSAVGNDLRLTGYDVTVGRRQIATETRFWGRRSQEAINATKMHEDKHVADAKALHDKYHAMLGSVVGHVSPGSDPNKAATKAANSLANQFDRKVTSHEPRSEWKPILQKEDEGNSLKIGPHGVSSLGHPNLNFGHLTLNTQQEQGAANPAAKVNPFGAFQSSPFSDGPGNFSQLPPHIP